MDKISLRNDTYRLIASHFPPIQLFENLLDPDEFDAAYALESMTNNRFRHEVGDISLVAHEDRVTGSGTTPIMAAFTHFHVESRFTKGHYGVYYAGLSLETALAESKFSRARFLSATNEGSQVLTMRCYKCVVDGELVDLRNDPKAHDPDHFAHAQAVAQKLRDQNEMGILYKSVRHEGGECIAALRPSIMQPPAVQAGHYQFHWNGSEITSILEVHQIQ